MLPIRIPFLRSATTLTPGSLSSNESLNKGVSPKFGSRCKKFGAALTNVPIQQFGTKESFVYDTPWEFGTDATEMAKLKENSKNVAKTEGNLAYFSNFKPIIFKFVIFIQF